MTPSRRRSVVASALAVAAAISAGCDSSSSPAAPTASGLAPHVEFDVSFGEAPLTGTLRLTPFQNSVGWRYRVEGLGEEPVEGAIEDAVSLAYRFESVGSHRVRVEVIGDDDPVVVEKRLVVTDPDSDFEVLGLLPVEEIWSGGGATLPEGIVLDAREVYLYVADYPRGEVVEIDAGTMEPSNVERRFHLLAGAEGLDLTPSGQLLLAAHKQSMFSATWLRGDAPGWQTEGIGEHYVEVLDESHALVSGLPLVLVNLDRREVEHEAASFHARHFAVDRQRGRVAVANLSDGAIEILELPSLEALRTIPLDPFHSALVAFDPHEDKAYAVAEDEAGLAWFLVFNPTTGARLSTTPLGTPGCSGFCAANPVTTFGEGRFVAFEQPSSVLVVDTALDQPRYRFGTPPIGVIGGPAGVAAQRGSDLLYVLGGPYEALTKIRLRDSGL
ncbi:MAG TPA: hypothetical protein VMR66_08700 [Gemmatimonadota bacterium]|nr:hypothetical protein [Gemmatimonadota bacterium]